MARKATITHNVPEVVKWMEENATKLEKAVFSAMVDTATDVENSAVKRAPRSARLRKRRSSRGGGARLSGSLASGVFRLGKTIVGFVGTNVPYAKYTEFGTKGKGGIKVGTPKSPRTSWKAKSARQAAGAAFAGRGEQSMPWLRAGWHDVRGAHLRRMRAVGKGL